MKDILINRVGQRFELWTVIGPHEYRKRKTHWRCRCDCGTVKFVYVGSLLQGTSTNCGCRARLRRPERRRTHGMCGTRAYNIWRNMRSRARGLISPELYAERGITMDPRWESFPQFLADMGEPPEGTSIDRIDNDGPYTKENCRWATPTEQRRNTRQNRRITFRGETLCVEDWAQRLGVRSGLLLARITRLGWSAEETLTVPVGHRRPSRSKVHAGAEAPA